MKKQSPIFIIEHLEPELFPWCIIEYKNISKIVGKNNVWVTNIKTKDKSKLSKYCSVFQKSVKALNLKNTCTLDPESPNLLTSNKAKNYNYFIFGGILGSFPAKKRTKKELTKFIKKTKAYNIGKEQMSTDNAVYVTNQIIKGKNIKEIPFKDSPEIRINKIESTILPYRYALIKNKPLISKELIKFLKKQE